MHRRDLLSLAAGAGTAALAGCTGLGGGSSDPPGSADDCTVTEALGGAPEIPVQADGEFADADAALDVAWTARTQGTVAESSDAVLYYEADEGNTFLAFALEVTNPADDVVTVDQFNFQLAVTTPDTVDELGVVVTGLDYLEANVRPDGTVSGHLLFEVPADATEATLRPREANFPDRSVLGFDPTCEDSISVAWPTVQN